MLNSAIARTSDWPEVASRDHLWLSACFYYVTRVELDIYFFQFKADSTNAYPGIMRVWLYDFFFFTWNTYWPKDIKSYNLLCGVCVPIHEDRQYVMY